MRTIAITGSASGIGAATTDLLRSRGHEVIGVDLERADVCADLSTIEGRQNAVTGLVERAPQLDAVIACAGVASGPVVIEVNYFGVVEFLNRVRPLLARSAAPRAAVVASSVAIHASTPELVALCLDGDEAAAVKEASALRDAGEGAAVYSASKAALSRWVRRESISPAWAGSGIPLNAVGPGVVITPMTKGLLADQSMIEAMDKAVPMPLNGHQGPESIAAILAFLTSVENTHMTGQVLFADGGAEPTLRGSDTF